MCLRRVPCWGCSSTKVRVLAGSGDATAECATRRRADHYSLFEMVWAFSIYLEAVAILPQLFLLQKQGEVHAEKLISTRGYSLSLPPPSLSTPVTQAPTRTADRVCHRSRI